MGSDDLFKKRREERKKRKYEHKLPKANSYLIVTEGECTEPLYFKGLEKAIKEKIGGRLDVVEVPNIEISGEGCSTCKLIEKTEEIISKAKIMYQNVWIVFDKDDFSDYDKAISEGIKRGYKIAWSNQCFEYWLYLHFYYSDSALHRSDWKKKLDNIFKERSIPNNEYSKNMSNIYETFSQYGSIDLAIMNAKKRMELFDENRDQPSEFDPGTTVHQLVEELYRYLKD